MQLEAWQQRLAALLAIDGEVDELGGRTRDLGGQDGQRADREGEQGSAEHEVMLVPFIPPGKRGTQADGGSPVRVL